MAKKATTSVAKKEQNLPDARLKDHSGMMDEADIDARDLVLAKILMMQPVSTFVAEEKATVGQLVGSLEANLLAKKDEKIELIFLKRYKTWANFKLVGKNKDEEFDSIIPLTAENANDPREEDDFKRYETLNYYVIPVEDLKKPEFIPYVVSFKSTNYKRGKLVESIRAKMKKFKKPLAFKTILLGTEQTKNEKGTFFLNTVEEGRDTTDEELSKAGEWFNIIKNAEATDNVKVDDSAERTEPGEVPDNAEGDY